MPHPHQATIDLFNRVLAGLPGVFPAARKQEMQAAMDGFLADPAVLLETIEKRIILFGTDLWPYVEAYRAFYRIYGEAKEHELTRSKLSEPARLVFDKFAGEGGHLDDALRGAKFETFFDAGVRGEIVEAEAGAHEEAHKEMERLINGEKRAEFESLLASHREKLAALSEKIRELENLALRSEKWRAEIADKAKTFEMGLAYIERMPSLEDIRQEVQYYVDTMEIGG